jgi:RNA polymerase sigma factor (sigma-70 family)
MSRKNLQYVRAMSGADYQRLLQVARDSVRGMSPSAFPNLRDDVAQDAVDELLRKDLLDGHPNPEALVVQAVRWRSIDTQRRWDRAKQLRGGDAHEADAGEFPPWEWQPSPSERVAELDALRDALESLSPDDRLILWLHDVEVCSFEEVAAELDISVGTARNRASAARKKLRESLR